MATSLSGSTVLVQQEVSGLALEGTFGGGTLPTTAGVFAPGCKLTNSNSGDVWTNIGTTAVPVWNAAPRTKVVPLTAAQIIAMYATPVEIVPAVSGSAIILDSMEFVIVRTSTAFTGGGAVAVQYNSTANGAGTATTATIASTVITGAAGTSYTARIPVVLSDIATASITGIGLYISNASGAFAAGTGTASVKVTYHLV